MEINFKLVAVFCTINAILAILIVVFGDVSIFIEAGVMNFWAMIGALGAFICSSILLIIKLAEILGKENVERGY